MTTPTTAAIPSASPLDLLYNAEQIDRIVNGSDATYSDRFGIPRMTLAGAVDSIKAITVRGAWATGTSYAVKDVVSSGGAYYIAMSAHVSGASFAGDQSTYWRLYQGLLASDLADSSNAAKGAGMAGFSATLNYVGQTIGKRLRDSGMNATDFPWLAKFDGTTDDTAAIQACIDWVHGTQGGGWVGMPAGRAITTENLMTYGSVEMMGQGGEVTFIEKTTNTVGSGTSRARSAAVTDSYAVDSIISIWHDDTASGTLYAYRPKITGVTLEGCGNTYGIYAPRISHAMFEDVQITDVVSGFATYDGWMCTHKRVTCQGVAYGWRHINDGSDVGAGTSTHFEDCWANFDNTVREPVTAFDLYGLTYSALTCCGADNLIRTDTTVPYVYQLSTCLGITMTACAAESCAAGFMLAASSQVTLLNPRTFNMSCNAAWATSAAIYNDSSAVVITAANFSSWSGAGGSFYNQLVQNGAKQVEIESQMPGGGDAFISYSSGSSRTVIYGGQVRVITAGGTANTVPLMGSATFDPPSLAAGAVQQTTVTVTGAVVGDLARATFSVASAGTRWTAEVTAANTVTVTQENMTGSAIDLASGTLKAWVTPQ